MYKSRHKKRKSVPIPLAKRNKVSTPRPSPALPSRSLAMLTLYTLPHCGHCLAAKQWLDGHGFSYHTIDAMDDPAALAFLRAEGHRTVPQIYIDGTLLEGGAAGLRAVGGPGRPGGFTRPGPHP